ncbi:SoxR reducing system RseC family protein [Methylophilaceae bacterium]|nr:SoxR reducing system RseC family protein [Methylophilaceae bacterium]
MIEEQAVVIFKEDDQVSVEIMRTKPCGLCGKTQGCGNSIWGKIFSHKRNMLSIKNNIGVKVGDRVMLTIEENYLLRSSLLLYRFYRLLKKKKGATRAFQFRYFTAKFADPYRII